jgi:hypothetical protein
MNIICQDLEVKSMNKFIFRIILGIAIFCAMIPAVSATEILVESNQLVVKEFDDSIGLGAFSVVISYDPAKTTVTDVVFIEPFTGATNIQPDEKTIRVSGFTVRPQLTGNIPIARMVYEGEERFTVYVDTFVNSRGDDVSTINSAYDEEPPTSPSAKPTTGSITESTDDPQTVTTVTTPRTSSPQATGTILQGSEDTPPASTHQQTGDSGLSDGVEPTLTDAKGMGEPAQTQAAKSPMPPILGILAFLVVLTCLRRSA